MASRSRPELNWSEITAGAFAALTGAVTASALGLYGTLVGAGVMSVVTTVVATISHHYLSRTQARLHRSRETDTPAGSRGTPRRVWRGLAGGTVLVAGTAAGTVATMHLLGDMPLRGLLPGHGHPRVIEKRILVDDDTDHAGQGTGEPRAGADEEGQEVEEAAADGAARPSASPRVTGNVRPRSSPTRTVTETAAPEETSTRTSEPREPGSPTSPTAEPTPDTSEPAEPGSTEGHTGDSQEDSPDGAHSSR